MCILLCTPCTVTPIKLAQKHTIDHLYIFVTFEFILPKIHLVVQDVQSCIYRENMCVLNTICPAMIPAGGASPNKTGDSDARVNEEKERMVAVSVVMLNLA